ncbi:hypothetical protein LTR28_006163, partial [Elasticomyces elasticus]
PDSETHCFDRRACQADSDGQANPPVSPSGPDCAQLQLVHFNVPQGKQSGRQLRPSLGRLTSQVVLFRTPRDQSSSASRRGRNGRLPRLVSESGTPYLRDPSAPRCSTGSRSEGSIG